MRTLVVLASLALATPALGAGKFTLHSTDVKPNASLSDEQVFNGFGCSGANLSPELAWENPPTGTQSFVVTVYDPDAPTGSGWWHWLVYDIPASAKSLPKGAGSGKAQLPEGAKQGRSDFGKGEFGGACPPPGDKPHRYIFTVYALKIPKLDVPENASGAMIGFAARANALGTTSFTAHYGRKK